jgi:hypothetical protein
MSFSTMKYVRKEELAMHPALLNGKPKCSLIECFDGEVIIIRPGFKKSFGKNNLKEAQKFIEEQGWESSIEFIMGSHLKRNILNFRG